MILILSVKKTFERKTARLRVPQNSWRFKILFEKKKTFLRTSQTVYTRKHPDT